MADSSLQFQGLVLNSQNQLNRCSAFVWFQQLNINKKVLGQIKLPYPASCKAMYVVWKSLLSPFWKRSFTHLQSLSALNGSSANMRSKGLDSRDRGPHQKRVVSWHWAVGFTEVLPLKAACLKAVTWKVVFYELWQFSAESTSNELQQRFLFPPFTWFGELENEILTLYSLLLTHQS